jgi:hypothetical protein
MEIAVLRAQATKERKLCHRVELNLGIKRLEAELFTIRRSLAGEFS